MANIEKIVADYETCKKAWEMGLRLESVFRFFYSKQGIWGTKIELRTGLDSFVGEDSFGFYYPAPTAEEVPLPDYFRDNINISIKCDRDYCFAIYLKKGKKKKHQLDRFRYGLYEKFNEATARLQMAIWLIENVGEARRWYIDNNYLWSIK